MSSNVAFFVLKVPERWKLESLVDYMYGDGVPKGILSCDAVGIAVRNEGQWDVMLMHKDLCSIYLSRQDFSLLNILSDDRLQQASRIAFVVQESDFEDFSVVANARSISGQYCVFPGARLQKA